MHTTRKVKVFNKIENATDWFEEKANAFEYVAPTVLHRTPIYYEDNILTMEMLDVEAEEED